MQLEHDCAGRASTPLKDNGVATIAPPMRGVMARRVPERACGADAISHRIQARYSSVRPTVAETREVCLPGNRIEGRWAAQWVVGRIVFSFSLTRATSAEGEIGLTT